MNLKAILIGADTILIAISLMLMWYFHQILPNDYIQWWVISINYNLPSTYVFILLIYFGAVFETLFLSLLTNKIRKFWTASQTSQIHI